MVRFCLQYLSALPLFFISAFLSFHSWPLGLSLPPSWLGGSFSLSNRFCYPFVPVSVVVGFFVCFLLSAALMEANSVAVALLVLDEIVWNVGLPRTVTGSPCYFRFPRFHVFCYIYIYIYCFVTLFARFNAVFFGRYSIPVMLFDRYRSQGCQ